MPIKPEYPVVLRPLASEDGGGWIAVVPDLPGCMSDGETAADALTNVQDAIEDWKDAAREIGRVLPSPDAFLTGALEREVPEHIRKQAETFARQMNPGRNDLDPSVVHAILAEWARAATQSIRI